MSEEQEEFYKVVLIGQSGVGKTCIIDQYINGKFDINTMSTISSQYIRKTIEFPDGKAVTFNIFDTAGQEKYRALTRIFYKDAKIVILVYDITNMESFKEMKEYWYEEVKQNGIENVLFAIAANKSDLYELRQVDDEEGEEYAQSIGAIFAATSAKNDTGITSLFENIGQKLLSPDFDPNEKNNKNDKSDKNDKEQKKADSKPNVKETKEQAEKSGEKKTEKKEEKNGEKKTGKAIEPTQSFSMNRKTLREGEIRQQERKKTCC